MSKLLIAYDLKDAKSERYQEVEKAIRDNFSTYAKVLNTTWIVVTATNTTTLEATDLLNSAFKSGDKLFVIALGQSAAWLGLTDEKVTNWLKEQIPK